MSRSTSTLHSTTIKKNLRKPPRDFLLNSHAYTKPRKQIGGYYEDRAQQTLVGIGLVCFGWGAWRFGRTRSY